MKNKAKGKKSQVPGVSRGNLIDRSANASKREENRARIRVNERERERYQNEEGEKCK